MFPIKLLIVAGNPISPLSAIGKAAGTTTCRDMDEKGALTSPQQRATWGPTTMYFVRSMLCVLIAVCTISVVVHAADIDAPTPALTPDIVFSEAEQGSSTEKIEQITGTRTASVASFELLQTGQEILSLESDDCCIMDADSSLTMSQQSLFPECSDGDCWLRSDQRLLHDFEKIPIGDWKLSTGGSLRYRFMNERNRLRPPLRAGEASYNQWRYTQYVQADYKDRITLYAELIDASTFNSDLPLQAADENRWDLLQGYIDVKIFELEDGDGHYRYGRQMLSYGSQHLISPLAWSNTYRNFQGHRAYYVGETWNVDVIAVNPVDGAARFYRYHPHSFDNPAQDCWLGGIYATNKQFGAGTLDLYWLWSSVNSPIPNVINGDRYTLGSRWAGKKKLEATGAHTLSWDFEAAYQYGSTNLRGPEQDIQAGFVSTNTGLTFDELPWTPTLTGVFWWGSGDKNPNDGTNNTVSTLYPLGHAYWGMIDNFNGSNLLDYSLQMTVKPTDRFSFLTAWHYFSKASSKDAIYNVGGTPFIGFDASPPDLGTELDLVATYQVNKNLTFQLGYLWFWYGDAVTKNPDPLVADRGNAENLYFYVDWKF